MTARAMRFRDLGLGAYRDRLMDLVRIEVTEGDVRGLYVWVKRGGEPLLSQYQRAMPFQRLAAMCKGELAVVFDPLCEGCEQYGCHGCHEALRQKMMYCRICYTKWKFFDQSFYKNYQE